jgi:hypothetical protein
MQAAPASSRPFDPDTVAQLLELHPPLLSALADYYLRGKSEQRVSAKYGIAVATFRAIRTEVRTQLMPQIAGKCHVHTTAVSFQHA